MIIAWNEAANKQEQTIIATRCFGFYWPIIDPLLTPWWWWSRQEMAGEGRRGSTNRVVGRIVEIQQPLILLECLAMIEECPVQRALMLPWCCLMRAELMPQLGWLRHKLMLSWHRNSSDSFVWNHDSLVVCCCSYMTPPARCRAVWTSWVDAASQAASEIQDSQDELRKRSYHRRCFLLIQLDFVKCNCFACNHVIYYKRDVN